jgi:hypothetical protein
MLPKSLGKGGRLVPPKMLPHSLSTEGRESSSRALLEKTSTKITTMLHTCPEVTHVPSIQSYTTYTSTTTNVLHVPKSYI